MTKDRAEPEGTGRRWITKGKAEQSQKESRVVPKGKLRRWITKGKAE